jgi:hypothetical protein
MTVQWKKEKNESDLHFDFLMHYNNRIRLSGDQYNFNAHVIVIPNRQR